MGERAARLWLWARRQSEGLTWCLWFSLLAGTPAVLSLPGPLGVEGQTLAFSWLHVGMAVSGVFGALSGRLFRGNSGDACAKGQWLRRVGFAFALLYAAVAWCATFVVTSPLSSVPIGLLPSLLISASCSLAGLVSAFCCARAFVVDESYEASWGRGSSRAWYGDALVRCLVILDFMLLCSLAAAGLISWMRTFLPNETLVRYSLGSMPTGLSSLGLLGSAVARWGLVGAGPFPLVFGMPATSWRLVLVPVVAFVIAWALYVLRAVASHGSLWAHDEALLAAGEMCAPALGYLCLLVAPSAEESLACAAGSLGVALLGLVAVTVVALALLGGPPIFEGGVDDAEGSGLDGSRASLAEWVECVSEGGATMPPRELQAVQERLGGKTSSEAALNMGISPSTVRSLQAGACTRLGFSQFDELAHAYLSWERKAGVASFVQGESHKPGLGGAESLASPQGETCSPEASMRGACAICISCLLLCILGGLMRLGFAGLGGRGQFSTLVPGSIAVFVHRVAVLCLICAVCLVMSGPLAVRRPQWHCVSVDAAACAQGLLLGLVAGRGSVLLDALSAASWFDLIFLVAFSCFMGAVWARMEAMKADVRAAAVLAGIVILACCLSLGLAPVALVCSLLAYELVALRCSWGWGLAPACAMMQVSLGIGLLVGSASSALTRDMGVLPFLMGDYAATLHASATASSLSIICLGLLVLLGAYLFSRVAGQAHDVCAGASDHDGVGLEVFLTGKGLNKTQIRVACLLVAGLSRNEIARDLCLSIGSINAASYRIYRCLGVHSRAGLVRVVRDYLT